MKLRKSEHWVTEPRRASGVVSAYGMSSWNVPGGGRLRREMRRSTWLPSVKHMLRWARKYGLDVTTHVERWKMVEEDKA